ncbi:MAG: diguanylate cyclase domain-containing protein [Aeromonadaceae bacterium]
MKSYEYSGDGVREAEAETREPHDEILRLRNTLAALRRENRQLHEKLDAALDGTGLCIWQGMVKSGELTVFNLQEFEHGQMAPHFDLWQAKLHPEDRAATLFSYQEHLAGRTPFYEAEYRTLGPDGSITWLWDRGRVVEWDEAGQPLRVMGSHVDITRRKESERRLAQQAQSDPLTGLLNRQAFAHAVVDRIARLLPQQTATLLFIDLDDFKSINDRFGHLCGDNLLVQVAEWLQQLAPPGALLTRQGGDEFLLYHDQAVDESAITQLARQLLARGEQFQPWESQPLSVGMSIGIALWLGHTDYELALELADLAMYQAKQGGKQGQRLLWL